MGRVFNTTGVCIPEKHYMVNINGRLQQIKVLVDEGKYFTINRAKQYGKTTTLRALAEMLRDEYENLKLVWTENGFNEAVRILLAEKNPLFESLVGKICDYPELSVMLKTLLFTGRNIAYNPDETSIDMAQMFGFIKNQNGNVVIANRIFEMRLYNYYLTEAKMQQTEIYKAALQDKSQFIVNGYLEDYHVDKGYMLSFNFNRKKQSGIRKIIVNEKTIVEAVV